MSQYICELCGHPVLGPVDGRSCGQGRMVVSKGTYRTGLPVPVPCGGKFVWAGAEETQGDIRGNDPRTNHPDQPSVRESGAP